MNGLMGPTLLVTLVAGAACTRANPAFRGVSRSFDDAGSDEYPPPVMVRDAGEQSDPPEYRSSDVGLPEDQLPRDLAADISVAPDALTMPDVAPPPGDVAPPPRDLAPDTVGGVVTNGLVAYWPFDDLTGSTAFDATMRNNQGTLMRGAMFTPMGFPTAMFLNKGALQLGGMDEYVDIVNRSLPRNEAPKTISLWFRAVNPGGLPIRTMVSLANTSSQSTGLQIGLDQGRIATWTFGDIVPMVAGSTVDGNWRHAAVTYDDRTDLYVLYYEGNMQGMVLRDPTPGAVTTPRIGTWKQPEEMFQGAIDDVRVYARALRIEEIRMLAEGQ